MFANRHWSHAERARTIGTKPLPALLSGGSGLQQPGSMKQSQYILLHIPHRAMEPQNVQFRNSLHNYAVSSWH